MHTLVVIKLALIAFSPSQYTAPWVDGKDESTLVYKTPGRSLYGRMPWKTEKLVQGLPTVIAKGRI